jgi:hypothetical protein
VAASSATTPPLGGFTYITPSTTIGIVCCDVAVPPGPGTGCVTGSADRLVSHAGPRFLTFDLSICVRDVYPWKARLPEVYGQSLPAGSRPDCANATVGAATAATAMSADAKGR